MLQATHFGVASNATYWSTARSGGADGLGVASNATYWSTARSGGADGLGIVSPYNPEINRTLRGNGLGIVPNDFELARTYGWYTPVHHGWINGRRKWYPGGNLGDAATATACAGAEDYETKMLLRELVKAEKIKATMSIVSGIAVAVAASIAIFRAVNSKGRTF